MKTSTIIIFIVVAIIVIAGILLFVGMNKKPIPPQQPVSQDQNSINPANSPSQSESNNAVDSNDSSAIDSAANLNDSDLSDNSLDNIVP